MIDYFRRHLGAKLFLTYLIVILVGVFVVASTTQFILPGAVNRHMAGMSSRMGIAPGMMGGQGFGRGEGQGLTQDLYENFHAGFNEALAWAVLVATALALVVSILFSRNIVASVRAMMSASQHIAEGHYSERVQVKSTDELGQLAARFNQMAGQLEQVEGMRRQLIGDVTHELRTPLTAIKGSMEGLIDGVFPATAETFEQIHREADRLSRLVDDLQELSRVEAGAYQMDIKSVAVADLVDTAMRRLRRQYKEKDISLTSDLPVETQLVLADEDRIGQVLINLLSNGLQYTPAGGHVHISAETHGDEVYISIADTGSGIPAEHLPHIFTRFYRVDKSRSRAGGGSGIGLTITKHLVEAHGGRIWAESAGEGKGSTFTFTLRTKKEKVC